MKFDRSKILTVVTADQAKVGQKGWFAYDLETLERKVARDKPSELIHVYGEEQAYRFEKESNTCWSLFYPAPEPTYRPFTNDELNSLVGKVLTLKACGYPCLVTQRCTMTRVRVNGYLYNAQQLLELFTLDGKP